MPPSSDNYSAVNIYQINLIQLFNEKGRSIDKTNAIKSNNFDFCQAFIYTLALCRGHSWRVRLAKQETLTPHGHLVSPLI